MSEQTCNKECFEDSDFECDAKDCQVDHTAYQPKFSFRLFLLELLQKKGVWYVCGFLDCAIVFYLFKAFGAIL